EQTVGSWDKLDFVELYNEDSAIIVSEPKVGNWNKLDCNKLYQQEYDDETTSSSFSDKENFIVVENLIVYPKKGGPRKKRFKVSNELEKKYVSGTKQYLKIQKIRKQTQC
ncbi:19139_t:CDS:2, partial [Cetraspora pellucida]